MIIKNDRKITAIIIDNEQSNIDVLKHFLEKYCSSLIEIIGTAKSVDESVQLINSHKPQLLFLDVILDQATSFNILDKIEDYNYRIIFVTAYNEFALKAIKYNALDYVLKPIQIDDLFTAVNKAYSNITDNIYTNNSQIQHFANSLNPENGSKGILTISSKSSIDIIKTKEITHCKSDGRYTVFYLQSGDQKVATRNLGEYEGILNSSFFRIHNSYIVNVNYLKRVNKTSGNYCEMLNGNMIPISKRRQEKFFNFLKSR
jgi:two-component system LytT family response regulator